LLGWYVGSPGISEEMIEVMQFTGLHDRNGKEIYEGDVVRWDDASAGKYWRVAEVVCKPGHYTFRTEKHDFDMGSFIYCPDTAAHCNVMEVIGNIHENPDLIKEQS
jgi:uncharacterized phage protein (TIGR01671 family)